MIHISNCHVVHFKPQYNFCHLYPIKQYKFFSKTLALKYQLSHLLSVHSTELISWPQLDTGPLGNVVPDWTPNAHLSKMFLELRYRSQSVTAVPRTVRTEFPQSGNSKWKGP